MMVELIDDSASRRRRECEHGVRAKAVSNDAAAQYRRHISALQVRTSPAALTETIYFSATVLAASNILALRREVKEMMHRTAFSLAPVSSNKCMMLSAIRLSQTLCSHVCFGPILRHRWIYTQSARCRLTL
jgi:hypothetical protein